MKDELYHYGVPNMKWNNRRYQNPDGTYTPLGLKRRREQYAAANKKDEGKTKSAPEKRVKKAKPEPVKSVRRREDNSWTDEDYIAEKKKLDYRANYYQTVANYEKYRPKTKKEKARRFIKDSGKFLVDKVVIPSFEKAGKAYLTKVLKEAMGVNDNNDNNDKSDD